MSTAIITATYPFGAGEAFFDVELRAAAPALGEVIVVPTLPQSGPPVFAAQPARVLRTMPWSASTAWHAVRAAARRPRRALRVLRRVLRARCALATKVRCLRYLPKAFALADVLRAEPVEHVHAYWLSEPALIASTIAELNDIAWSASAHLVDITNNDLFPAYFAPGGRPPAFVRAISQRARDDIVRAAGDAAGALTTVLHVGVDVPPAYVRPAPRRELMVLCAAFLEERKGHRDLLDAIAALHRERVLIRCVLAGDGPLRASLARRIRHLGINDIVTLRGLVAHHQLLSELRAGAYDVMVLPSRELIPGVPTEGIPVSLMEAMAAGVACVGTATGGVGELLNGCGIVVPGGDAAAIAAALRVLARDPECRRRLVMRGRARIARSFNAETIGPELAALIRASSCYRAITDSTMQAKVSASAAVEYGGSTVSLQSPSR